LGGQHEGGVIGLGARVGEEHLGVGYATQLCDLLGKLDLGFDQIERRCVQHPVGLGFDRRDYLRHLVAGHGGEDPAKKVEILVSLGVDNPPTLTVDYGDGLGVVKSHPRGEDLSVSGE
jgi:hypothetical protein